MYIIKFVGKPIRLEVFYAWSQNGNIDEDE
jgi:hypothetical protein